METTVENPTFEKRNQAKLWLVVLFVIGVCIFSLCAASSGLILWQSQIIRRAEAKDAALNQLQQNQSESLFLATVTPTPMPAPSFESTSAAVASPPQAEPVSAAACPELSSINDVAPQTPTLSPISFATRQDEAGWPLDPALQFTTTATQVLATFNYVGMSDGLAWERVWLFGDEELSRGSGVWDAGPHGKLTVHAVLGEGDFAPGLYKLELYVAGQLLSEGTFLVVNEDTPTQRPVQVAYTTWDGDAKRHRLNLLDLATNQTELLLESAHSPAWAADARGLLFYGENGIPTGTPGLWVFNMGQRKSYQLNEEISFRSIAWSPYRTYVASTRTEGPGMRLVLWDINQNQAFDGPPGADPAWSPEGLRLAYRSCNEAGWHISTIQIIGSNFDTGSLQHLTSGDDSQPAWSWDGQWITFVRREGDNQDIYTVRADGSDLTRLTDHPAADVAPAWTPDHRLVFRSLRDGQWGIYMMNADGSDERQLVSTDSPPEWQPDRLAISTDVLVAEPPMSRPQIEVPTGHGLLAVSNQANNDEMTFTIDNVEHKIRPYQVRMLSLRPGHYTWTASWPGKNSRTGIADIALGQVAYPVVER